MTLFETERLYIDEVDESEINEIIGIESHSENRDYLWVGTADEHRAEIADPNHLLLIFHGKENGDTKGYALIRLDSKSHIFEIRRIAITDKGKGYGKESMIGLIRYAFECTDANRLWLDVYPDNKTGIKLYQSLEMNCDGVLRQNYLAERGYLDQIIYSLLKCEYAEWKKKH